MLLNPIMHGGNKRSFILEHTCSIKLQVCSSMYDLMLPPCIKGLKLVFLATNQNSWSICNFTVELQAYKKIITKHLSTSSAGVFSVKVIRKNYKMFWDKMSMRKPFLSKATCSSTKTEFLNILFPWKFQKMSRTKTKTFRKIINRACFNEYFYRYVLKIDKAYLQISFKSIFFKMLWADA